MSIAVAAPPSPYKGLAAFEDSELDALFFFGREHESEVIAANLIASRITVLYGHSGVGKSSVLRAGVAYQLRREQDAEVIVFSSWSGDPVAGVIEAAGGSGESLVDALADAADRAGGELYLVLDQFEECFLYHRRGGRFAVELARVLGRPGLRVNVLLGMREDSLARLDVLKASIPNLLANRLRLERLDRVAGAAAIRGPLTRYNELVGHNERVDIEPELEEAILDEVTAGRLELGVAGRGVPAQSHDEHRIEAPYLQLVLARLWDVELERGSRMLRLSTLRALGGAEHIVEDHLERAMAALSPHEKGAAAAMYNFLVTPSGTKIAHGVRDLAGYAAVAEGEAETVLRRLTAERIVRASSTNGPSTTRYEIFHDVLAEAVLAWRTRFEQERALEEERVRHERRHRRLVAIGTAALLGVAIMAAIAIYALAQRSNAQHQAAVAQAQRAEADRQRQNAETQRRKADKQKALAEAKAKEAQRSQKQASGAKKQAQASAQQAEVNEQAAQANAEKANAAALDALAQRARAEGNAVRARRLAAAAASARDRARFQEEIARKQRSEALAAKAIALGEKRIGHANELAAAASSLLSEDSEASVRQSLAAVQAFNVAHRRPSVDLEDTLRQGLLDLRLQAVLPGGGGSATRVQAVLPGGGRSVVRAEFSPDPQGSRLLIAGDQGARVYDRMHGYRVLRLRPATKLDDATFSPDGRLVAGAGAGRDHAVHVWDAQTGTPLYSLLHDDAVLSVAFSPDGRLIASGSADGTARVWSVAGGFELQRFVHPRGQSGSDAVRGVSFSPDSSRLLTVAGDRFARVFDVRRGRRLLALDNTVSLRSARFSHDGRLIATGGRGGADRLVRMWNADSGEFVATFTSSGPITDLAFSNDDSMIASVSSVDTTAHVWRVIDREAIAIIGFHRSGIEGVTFSPDGQSVATMGRDGDVYIARSDGGFKQAVLLGHNAPVRSAAFRPDGKSIVTAGEDGVARVWDARVDLSGPGPPGAPKELTNHGLAVNAVDFSPNGRATLSAGSDGTARLLFAGGGSVTVRQAAPVLAASFSRSGRSFITACGDGTAVVWRTTDGAPLAKFGHGSSDPQLRAVNDARLSPNGRIAATAGQDGTVKLWDVRTGSLRRVLKHHGAVLGVRFSRNGKLLVSASADRTAAVWRVSDGARLQTLTGHEDAVVAARFSPNGKRVATASLDGTAGIWNVADGELEHPRVGHSDDVTSVAFSPDGSLLATASLDRDVRVWSVQTGRQVALLQVHQGVVSDVAFSADGRWLATAGPGAAGVWETRRRGTWDTFPTYLLRGPGPARPINDIAFSPRGWRILFGSRDGSVRLYDCKLCGTIRQLKPIAEARLRQVVHPKP
jgi:WD40 repeat protein